MLELQDWPDHFVGKIARCGYSLMRCRIASLNSRERAIASLFSDAEVTASPRLAFRISWIMAKSIRDIPKKRRGRPSTGGRRDGILVRLEPDQFDKLDAWIAKQKDKAALSRPEAIRRLVELGLKGKASVPK
jgi:hypothetical protein